MDIVLANYHDKTHATTIVQLLNEYALTDEGGGTALSDYVQLHLVEALAQFKDAFSILAFINAHPIGLVNCFYGFSTFKCQPLVNVHDVYVNEKYRGQGISQKMLDKVEQIAKEKGCCKLTLEVLSGNENAKKAYQKYGFAGYALSPEFGHALFWQKSLNDK